MSEHLLTGFPAVADPDARVLILGSMPGEASLLKRQYYGHPQNQFWDVMGALFGAGRDIPYRARLDRLRSRRIALWDVIRQCRRAGSADAAIDPASIRVNDFAALFDECPGIRAICFNGTTAETEFRRRVLGVQPLDLAGAALVRMPSTSPAYAARSLNQKIASWQQLLDWLGPPKQC